MDNSEKLAKLDRLDEDKQNKKHSTINVGHHGAQANANNINKTWTLLQTTGGKNEPNIVSKRRSQRKSQHGTKNVKTHNRTTQKAKKDEQQGPHQIVPASYKTSTILHI